MKIITTQSELEGAVHKFGLLPFFPNNIKGFSIQEMTPPGLLFGGNEYDGCWEWKGPVVRNRTTAYGKFFRRKAGFVSRELLPFFLKWRRSRYDIKPGSTEEMIYDIISINDKMTSTDLRETISGKPRKRTAFDLPDLQPDTADFIDFPNGKRPSRHTLESPLQKLQMSGLICISDFRYKQTKKGEKYGWGVAEYSTPEMLFDPEDLKTDLTAEESLNYIIDYVSARFPKATPEALGKLLQF